MIINRRDEDIRLLSELSKGSQEAFEALYKRYYAVLCGYCRRFVSPEDSEEIVQDVMLWVWEKRKDPVIETSLGQYLFKAVYNRAFNRIIQLGIKQRADTYFYQHTYDMLHEVDPLQIEELSKRIKEAINNLPQSYKEAFVMHRFKDMSYKEIATFYNVSPKTIDYRIQQAMKQLRTELKDFLPLLWLLCFRL